MLRQILQVYEHRQRRKSPGRASFIDNVQMEKGLDSRRLDRLFWVVKGHLFTVRGDKRSSNTAAHVWTKRTAIRLQ